MNRKYRPLEEYEQTTLQMISRLGNEERIQHQARKVFEQLSRVKDLSNKKNKDIFAINKVKATLHQKYLELISVYSEILHDTLKFGDSKK